MLIKRTLKERALSLRRALRSSLSAIEENVRAQPIARDQILGKEQLSAHARDFAHRYYPSYEKPRDYSLLWQFGVAEDSLDTSYFSLAEAADNKEVLPPGSEWVLDNYHVIEEHIREIKKDLPRGYYRTLPQLRDGPYAAKPRVYALAVEYIRHRDSVFDGELLSSFISAYQELHPLSIGELWALPIMLRYVLLSNLSALSTSSLKSYRERKMAEEISEEVLKDSERPGTEMVLNLANRLEAWPGWVGPGAIHIMRRLRAIGLRTAVALHWIEERFRESGIDPDELVRNEQYARAADQISIGNCVSSLKAIGLFDWKVWVELNSKIHEALEKDPAGYYEQCDFATRDRYRHVIEQIARNSGKFEPEVAEQLIQFVKEQSQAKSASDTSEDLRKRHVGTYLLGEGRRPFEDRLQVKRPLLDTIGHTLKRHTTLEYFGAVVLFTGFLVSIATERAYQAGLPISYLPLLALLFAVVASNLAIQLVQWIVMLSVPPAFVPKLDYDEGLPAEVKSIVTVHSIFANREAVDRVVEAIEVRFLANDDPHLSFALLGDVSDSEKEVSPGDDSIIEHASELVQELNQRYCANGPERFFVLFRRRLFNPCEGRFMGWERKRGKIMEFNRLLAGDDATTFRMHVGSLALLRTHRYVITLDSDTQLPRGVARKLIGALHHPLNRPVIDHERRIVLKGYAVIQPRVGVSLRSALASLFSSIFCGHAGIDPYTSLVSEVYQDLFDEASYVGKGAYDPKAFEHVLSGRIPENSLLSHDLFESLFARTAHVSDVELIDDFPSRYNVYARREHRWIRGDWQLLPWLFPLVPGGNGAKVRNPLSWLGWWKIFDNIRRSLVAPAAFVLLLCAFTLFPKWPLFWFSLVLLTFLFPVGTNLANSVLLAPPRFSLPGYSRNVGEDFVRNVAQALFHLCVLPHQAYLVSHAAGISICRVFFSRRHLLEWETAYHSEQRSGRSARDFLRSMSGGVILTLLALAAILFWRPDNLVLAAPLLALWASAPVVAAWISTPRQTERYVRTQADEDYLIRVARQTWAYFDDHLIEEYNYLIPDNIQMIPTRVVAERTSPTNIGLSLLSLMTAHDLGFASLPYVATRTNKVFRTLLKLERWNGHFLNWYEIRSLRSLAPRYISAVDSGNLVGHLMAVGTGLEEVLHTPLITPAHFRQIRRAFGVLVERAGKSESALSKSARAAYQELKVPPRNFRDLFALLKRLREFTREHGLELRKLGADAREQDRMINSLCDFAALGDLVAWYGPMEELYTLLEARPAHGFEFTRAEKGLRKILLGKTPTLALLVKVHNRICDLLEQREKGRELRGFDAAAEEVFGRLREGLASSMPRAEGIFAEIKSAHEYAEKIVGEMKLAELYDSQRKAFVIGYNLDRGARDSGHYDLLASEARLTSFVAIARGEVPQQHWFLLGRPITESFGGRALLSWGGTMFEYFMPLLVMRDYPGTLLSDSYRSVIRSQQRYARLRNVPWGMSESGYAGVDFHKTYQYRAFGVPGLGLKRGLSEDLVISPYSTFLALQIAPRDCIANLSALDQEGVHGEYGFYEAIDYTPQRLSKEEERGHVVRNFLAHHQGMSLVAINNYLNQGVFQNRFHANVSVKATELLLHEKFPVSAPALVPHRAEQLALDDTEEGRASRQVVIATPHTEFPLTRLLSNGYYSVMIDNAGSGYSLVGGQVALTRWREDPVLNTHGTYIFLKDLANNVTWSAAFQPSRAEPDWYEAIFDPARVEFRRRDIGIVSHTEVVVSPDDNVEIRKVTLTNTSRRARTIEATSYAEVAMNDSRADLAHPAFSKMFVQSEFLPEIETILFWRRLRSAREEPLYMFHMLTMPICWTETSFETSREAFLGRGRTVHRSRALEPGATLLGNYGAVLDPVFSLRTVLELEPGAAHSVMFITGVARSREEALMLASRYREVGSVNRAFELAMSHSTVELRHQQFSVSQAHAFQRLANALIFTVPTARAESAVLTRNQLAQSGLWRFGISGDLPIVLVRVSEPPHLKLVNELLIAHEYLRLRGMVFDLVVLNEYPGGYFQHFQEELEFAVKAGAAAHLLDKRGGIYLRALSQLSEVEAVLLQTVARVILHGTKGSLSTQLQFSNEVSPYAWAERPKTLSPLVVERRTRGDSVERFARGSNRHQFTEDGKAYRIQLNEDETTPLPWSNVVANPRFGFLATERGGGYTWSENSRENRLTPWSNDPVTDPCGEALYVRDLNSGDFWSATPAPASAAHGYTVTHGFGYSSFQTEAEKIESTLTLCAAKEAPVKWWSIVLKNNSGSPRKLELVLYLDLVLGVQRETSSRHLITSYDERSKAIIARNFYNNEFAGRVVAAGSSLDIAGFTTRRDEFIGRNGSLASPLAFADGQELGERLTKTVGPDCDAIVLSTEVSLAPKERREILFFLCEYNSIEELRAQARNISSVNFCAAERRAVENYWRELTSAISVSSPSESFNTLMNGWLLYQTVSCRLFGRSAFYQSGGAIGFRDQLQDSLALLPIDPASVRKQILLHASRQFIEGDVQHWWHPPTGRGVRTRISDDLLWLPYVVHRYIEATGDASILEEDVSYIEASPLEEGVMEAYVQPGESMHRGSIYDHCIIAIDRGLTSGPHGLPLIGGGDWNDGMNEVGREGKGESVWLGWFLIDILRRFTPIVRERRDNHRAQGYEEHMEQLRQAIETHAWDGEWYMRAFYDDGSPLGSKRSDECRIDSIAQSWAVLSGAGTPERQQQALQSALKYLVKKDVGIIELLTPPFDHTHHDPGYIKGYLPGIRENGGQYTHAAAWLIIALASKGLGGEAVELFELINPINLTRTSAGIERYRGEPYVFCGDVYSNPQHPGRAGWSWYTGSAGWLYQAGLHEILGIRVEKDAIRVDPCIPKHWPGFEVTMRCNGGSSIEISVKNPKQVERGIQSFKVNGEENASRRVPRPKSGVVRVEVILG